MDVREALYTTRAMRRVKSDPIPDDVQARIMDAAIRAPSGSNAQNWRFILVDDPEIIAELAPIYRRCFAKIVDQNYADNLARAAENPDDPANAEMIKINKSGQYLADNFHRYPLLLLSFTRNDASGGAVFPATWSAMLAARAEGVGTALTSIFWFEIEEFLEVIGVPAGKGWQFAACVTFGYPTGKWGVGARRPVHEVAYRNTWGEPFGMEINEPLWSY